MAERRALTEDEKKTLIKRDGMRCFIDGHPIQEDEVEFDHIQPVASGGPTAIDNLAGVCRRHNRQKGTMALSEYRDYLQLDLFFSDGKPKYLDDVIQAKGHKVGKPLSLEVISDEDAVVLYFDSGKKTVPIHSCPATGWRYFYALMPVTHLRNDRDLQPRALRQKSMWDLYRHFLRNTQLAPSICRADGTTLLLFDGQHKAAAQMWAGRSEVECKVYISPDSKALKETNLEAHQSYRQMAFYSYELMKKYADIFGEDWSEYAGLEGRKSEAGFTEFLVRVKGMSLPKAKGEIAKAIHWKILNDDQNKLGKFVSEKSRARTQPLTYNRIAKTFFQHLLSPIPSTAEFQGEDDFREVEERNLVRLMSIIAEEGLVGKWNPELADAVYKRTERIFSAGAIRAWTKILRDVLSANLRLYMYGQEELKRVLHRQLDDDNFVWFGRFARQIFAHSVWDAPDTADQDISKRLTKDDDITAYSLLQERGLTVQWVLESAGRA